jgi:hypothetical protein
MKNLIENSGKTPSAVLRVSPKSTKNQAGDGVFFVVTDPTN